MNQENQNTVPATETQDATSATETQNTPKTGSAPKLTAEAALRAVSRGQMRLAAPFRASNKDIEVLHFDFTKLTGWEFAQALDRDATGKTNAFRLTQIQALELFAAAVNKMTPDVDAEDIRHRLGIEDAIKAAQIATSFFNFASRAANARIMS